MSNKKIIISIFVLFLLNTIAYGYSNIIGSVANSDAGGTNNDIWSLEGDYTSQTSDLSTLEGEIVSTLFGDFSFGISNEDIEFKRTSRTDCLEGTTYSISGIIKSFEAWGDMDFIESDSYYCPSTGEWFGKLFSDWLGYKEIGTQGLTEEEIDGLAGASYNTETDILVKGLVGSDEEVNIDGNITNDSHDNITTTQVLEISTPDSEIYQNINKNISILTQNITAITTNDMISNIDEDTYYFNFEGDEDLTASNENNKGIIVEIKGGNYSESNLTGYQVGVSGEKNIIIKGGNLYINSDIYNVDDNSILTIVVQRDDNNIENGGNIYINPNVTNIDAILIAEGSIINFDGTDVITDEDSLKNQLYIYGSTYTKNSIGTGVNPYGSDGYIKYGSDSTDGYEKYDFNELRHFDLIVANSSTADCPSDDNNLVPRISSNSIDAKKYAWAGKRECFNEEDKQVDDVVDNLRGTSEFNPLIIEYNSTISTNPPFILQNN